MARAQLIITAVVAEGRSKTDVARDYGVSGIGCSSWCSGYQREGPIASWPRSRRPHHSPHAVDADTEEMIIRLRKELFKQGLEAGAETIAAQLARCQPAGSGRPVASPSQHRTYAIGSHLRVSLPSVLRDRGSAESGPADSGG